MKKQTTTEKKSVAAQRIYIAYMFCLVQWEVRRKIRGSVPFIAITVYGRTQKKG